VISITPRPPLPPGKDPVPIVQEAGWAPEPVWIGVENLAPPGFNPWAFQPIASHYTNYTILAHSFFRYCYKKPTEHSNFMNTVLYTCIQHTALLTPLQHPQKQMRGRGSFYTFLAELQNMMLWPFVQNTAISSHSATLFGLLYPADEQTTIFKMSTNVHNPTKCNITQGFSKGFPGMLFCYFTDAQTTMLLPLAL
jgi:hypothetical protein